MAVSLRTSEWINLLYFAWIFVSSFLLRPDAKKWILLMVLALVGTGTVLTGVASKSDLVRDWLPAPVMIMAYVVSGLSWKNPNLKLQKIFLNWDRKILPAFTSILSLSFFSRLMELFYLLCYPMVPAGLVVLYFGGLKDASDLYWSAVLIPTYICYALVPLLGTLPPRLCETGGPVLRAEPIRLFNLWILKNASTNINMIPSGHVTASLAAALVLLDLMPLAGIVALMIALGIAAGAFGGRYHFAADVILAVLLTLTINIPLL